MSGLVLADATRVGLSAGLAVLVAFALTPLVRRYALRHGLVDQPGPRRSHDRPVARAGGIALVAGLLVGTLVPGGIAGQGVFVAGLLVAAALGLADDHRSLPVRIRLPVQLALAAAIVLALGGVARIEVIGLGWGPPWLWSPLAALAVVWMINLFNFMDGSDGLAAMQSLLSSGLLFAGFLVTGASGLAGLAAIVAAASLGFLAWNRPPASIFLGDSGSLSLGFALGFLALAGTTTGTLGVMAAAIAVSPFVIDATATLGARLASGRGWYTPHRDHAYQCLIRAGWSHGRVLAAWVAVNLLVVAPAFGLAVLHPAWDGLIAVLTGVMLLGLWRWARRRAPAENRDE